ncbi:Rha family transcriptional regulator [Enterococcus casseliflavus]|uniref:Rha family transcriptional regulator n=1 Tax=Enterococcus casseliflavus TaxID=37734 RepID=UPI00115F5104|nr:Rha family transcriptional regulator [Enterococcus casseliflavus]MDT2980433.1 Rha family transcriptional regulator [Enterococcus casseliflavus]MEB6212831.1 Rha family transcriptional regulator [Enterococcus casseliflavus]
MQNIERTLTSNEVAEMIGKDHSKLIRDIRTYIGYLAEAKIGSGNFFIESYYKDANNQERPNYLLTKQGCEMVSNKLTGAKGVQFTARYVSRFNEMETHIKEQALKIPETPEEALELMFEFQKGTKEKVAKVEKRVTDLEENTVLSAGDYSYITRRINQRVAEVARGFGKVTNSQRGELHKDINSGVKKITGVSTRTQLRQKHFQTVLDYITDWEPSTATKTIVRQMDLLD